MGGTKSQVPSAFQSLSWRANSKRGGKTKQTTFSSRPGSNVPEPDISTFELLAFGARSFFVARGWSVHCRMFSSTPSLYPLEVNIASDHLSETKISPKYCQMSPGGTSLLFRSTALGLCLNHNSCHHWSVSCISFDTSGVPYGALSHSEIFLSITSMASFSVF